jgi:predicted transcriptional regulator
MSTLLTIRTDDTTVEKLDYIAQSLDRNRNWVVNEAISQYLDMHAWRLEHITQGIADTDAGRSITISELEARIDNRHAKRTQQR